MSLRRYLVFGWDRYEASGGWHDFIYSYDSLDEAKQVLIKALPAQTHGQVVDTLAAEIVFDLEDFLREERAQPTPSNKRSPRGSSS